MSRLYNSFTAVDLFDDYKRRGATRISAAFLVL
jgi:hypothetical protein